MDVEHNASETHRLEVDVPNGPLQRQNNPGNNSNRRFFSYKTIVWLLVALSISLVVGLIVQGVKMGGHQSHGLVSCAPCHWSCPHDWLQFNGTCYYFSPGERNWTSSQEFCSSFNASLATIENEEKEAVMRYREKVPYWPGLTRRSAGQPWKWMNGQNATLKITGDGGNCAYLSPDTEAQAGVSRCSTEHRFICSRPAIPTGASKKVVPWPAPHSLLHSLLHI